MTSGELVNFTSTLILMLWISLQWRLTQDSRQRLAAAVIATLIPAFFLAAGHYGIFADFEKFPPPFMALPFIILGIALFLAFSSFGERIVKNVTLANLVLFHSFRLLAEAVIFLGVREGIAPVQMSFEGYQFDIVIGVSALVLGVYLRQNPSQKLAYGFNLMGLASLMVILFIAVTSMPTPLRLFMSEPSNIWVTKGPYILLPGVLVTAAFTGHFLIFRKLKSLSLKHSV